MGERKSLALKEKALQGKKITHSEKKWSQAKRNCLVPKENFSQQNKEEVKKIVVNETIYTIFIYENSSSLLLKTVLINLK